MSFLAHLIIFFLGFVPGFLCGVALGYFLWHEEGKRRLATRSMTAADAFKYLIATLVSFVWVFGNISTDFALDYNVHLIFGAIVGSMFGVDFIKKKNG